MTTPAPVTFRGRLWRWTKRLSLTATLLLVAAAPATYFGVPALARHKKVHDRVEKALSRALGTPVEIGALSFTWKEGLDLRDVSSAEGTTASFHVDRITLSPRLGKACCGKARLRVTLENPEIVVDEAGAALQDLRFPKFGKKGLRLDQVKIQNGTFIVKNAGDDRTLRIEGITTEGPGRLQGRSVRIEFASLAGSYNDVKIAGKGFLKLSPDGFAGVIDLNDEAAKEPALRDALRAAHLTIKKAPELSDPF
ncbi:MAG: hypothetical protein HY293_20525 [Planctomycetes bacterium]|nr:hypothetical protein [Planctomycetota bacterium]